ncbi:hypothetical protein GGR55DRAFT_670290 [Xylaria sp. FL0064]|nr:hypothetical protein GGR55DRAFT_670290 [Xylaria sp. FL0064]
MRQCLLKRLSCCCCTLCGGCTLAVEAYSPITDHQCRRIGAEVDVQWDSERECGKSCECEGQDGLHCIFVNEKGVGRRRVELRLAASSVVINRLAGICEGDARDSGIDEIARSIGTERTRNHAGLYNTAVARNT